MTGKKMVCTNCGIVSVPQKKVPGYFAVELLLWCLFVLPGLAYTLWRISNKQTVCPACRTVNMIPVESPIAQKILNA